ncbi:MAG: DUF6167 family protein [Aeromicrobium sp.]
MKSRIVWFVAGSATGVYTAVKARRAAYRLSAPGIVDQAGALGLGWRAFSSELRDGMQSHEHEIVRRLTAEPSQSSLSLDQTPSDKKAT